MFYDTLAPFYHLIFADWDESIVRQGEQLSKLIDANWPATRRVLDLACGIGTQSLALAQRNYIVVGSDISEGALKRARQEARQRELQVVFSYCDMRAAHERHGDGFDLVLCADNSLPHLLTDEEILLALQQMHACLVPGGGCVITVRDYDAMQRGRGMLVPYPVHEADGHRYILFQRLDFRGDYCTVLFCVVDEQAGTRQCELHKMKTYYYAVSTDRLCELMREAGFRNVRRVDGAFYQPVLIGTR